MSKLLEYCEDYPVWIMGGLINSRKVLVGEEEIAPHMTKAKEMLLKAWAG